MAHQLTMDADGVAILPLSAEESDSSEVVHTFSGGAVAMAAPAAAATATATPAATTAVPPPALDMEVEGAPPGAAGGQPTSADLEQGAASPAPASAPFLVPEHMTAVGHRAGPGADEANFEAPTTKYIPYVTDPPPPSR